MAQIAKLHVKKSFEQTTAHLKSWRETQEDSAGLSAPKLSDPLLNSVEGLTRSEHPTDTGAAALSCVSELLRLYMDGRNVLMNGWAGVPDLLSRYTTVSFTVSKGQSSHTESVAQPSVLDSVELLFEGPSTHLEGVITAKRLVVLSDEFTTGAGESTSSSSASQQSGSVGINLLNLTALPGLSYSESSETTERRSHLPSSIKIDDLYIRVKDMVLKGTTIQAKLVDAIVEGNLTIEALMGWFHREADSFAISSSGDVRASVQERTLQQIDAAASLIGTEEFYLTVGGTLLTKSATFGLRPIGVVAEPGAERINAGKIIEEQLQEIDEEHNLVINLPLGTIMTLAGQLTEIQKIRSQTYDHLLSEGLSEDDAAQVLGEMQGVEKELVLAEKEMAEAETQALHKIQDRKEIKQTVKKAETPIDPNLGPNLATQALFNEPADTYSDILSALALKKQEIAQRHQEKLQTKIQQEKTWHGKTVELAKEGVNALGDLRRDSAALANALLTRPMEVAKATKDAVGELAKEAWAATKDAASHPKETLDAVYKMAHGGVQYLKDRPIMGALTIGEYLPFVSLASAAAKDGTQYFATDEKTAPQVAKEWKDRGVLSLVLGKAIGGLAAPLPKRVFKKVMGEVEDVAHTKKFGKNKPTQPHYDYSTPEAPFSLPIDPITRKGPMHVDANQFTSADSYTQLGFARNKEQFWNAWEKKYSGMLSEKNRGLLSDGLSPKVDAQWVKHFPEHQRYLGCWPFSFQNSR